MASYRTSGNVSLDAALERLFSLQTFGIKLGLEPTLALLEAFGNPHHKFPTIHVAGTNGKGSICSMIASVLQAHGLRTGLYTSPHLVKFNERIRVNGSTIPDSRLAQYTQEMMPTIEELGCTFFEGTTAMGFRYFAEERVDVAVIETGMGGRLDSTNVLTPLVSVITSIALDHTRHLGETLEEIAAEKGGIIKTGIPAVVGRIRPRLRSVFQKQAQSVGAEINFADDVCRGIPHETTVEGTTASFMMNGQELQNVLLGLPGRHQIENAAVVLTALEHIRDRFRLNEESIRAGLRDVRYTTGIRGRLELLQHSPDVLVDVAHNPDGITVLTEAIASYATHKPGTRVHIVYGAVKDKDVAEVATILKPRVNHLYAVRADSPRSLPADEIAYYTQQTGIPTTLAGSVPQGIQDALSNSTPDDLIVICGSFFVAGEAIAFFERDLFVTGVQEENQGYDITARPTESTGNAFPANGFTIALQEQTRNTVKEWHAHEQPRERLMALGPQALSTAELVAILLRTGRKGEDVVQVSRKLLHRFASVSDLAARDIKELQQIDGIGPTKAVTLAAAFELANRISSSSFKSKPVITCPGDVAQMFIPKLRVVRKEQFHVVIMNAANQVIRTELVSEGSLNSSVVYPREVFRTAIIESAASIIGLHNHPSGNPEPSNQDITITRQLVEAGRVLGINFHDHLIIAGDEFVSLAELGYI